MSEVPYTNNGDRPVHVDGKRILPGETRPVSAAAVPPAAVLEETDLDGGDVLDLLDGRAVDIVEALPELSDDQLRELLTAEQNGKTRKTVVEAIAEEQLRRADDTGLGDAGGGDGSGDGE